MIKNEHIARYIGILANRLRREIDALASCGEYSGAEGKILHFILAHTDSEIFQKDLEEEFGMRPSSASALIKKMEQNGLITRGSRFRMTADSNGLCQAKKRCKIKKTFCTECRRLSRVCLTAFPKNSRNNGWRLPKK